MRSHSIPALALVPALLGVPFSVHGQCVNDCGVGDTAEGEPCLVDFGEDTTNGGCNSDPVVFGPGSCSTTICGVVSTYDVDTDDDGQLDSNFRDTDWYLISQDDLLAADLDGNGVVQVTSTLFSEFDGVTFFLSLGDPTCVPSGGVGSTGFSGPFCAGGDPAVYTLVIAEHPNGVAAFVSSGNPNGSGIFDGFECSTGQNDYTVTLACSDTFEACQPGPPQGPCGEPNDGVMGCEDPECCKLVCETFTALCCFVSWSQDCADAAVDLGCGEEPGGPVCMATGGSSLAEGFLEVCADAYGSVTSPDFSGSGDRYNPVGPHETERATFSGGFLLFKDDTVQRELLSTNPQWQSLLDDTSLEHELLADHQEFDDNGDGVTDRLVSSFRVFGAGVDLTFDLDQAVDQTIPPEGGIISTLTQTYTITNDSGAPVDFELVRLLDGDLVWVGDFGDDSVGTVRSGDKTSVFIQEFANPPTRITVSSPDGTAYFGAKRGVDPDGAGGDPAMGYGTDTQVWDSFGIPDSWRNFIAGVGYDMDGESGPAPEGCADPCDALVGLEILVSLSRGESVTFTVEHAYGTAAGGDGGGGGGDPGFDPPEEFASDGEPIIHALGDLDGDGDTDVAVAIPDLAGKGPGKLQIFRNQGVNPMGEWLGLVPNAPITLGVGPSGIALGFYDSDPFLDIAITNAGDDNVWILLNNGTGDATFTVFDMITVGDGPSGVVTQNFNGGQDSFADLAVVNEFDSNVVVLFGDGNGNFSAGLGAGGIGVGQGPVEITTDDFDDNKCPDLSGPSNGSAAAGGGTVFVLCGNPDGTFDGPFFFSIGNNPKDISTGDLNHDTLTDIVTVNADDNTVSVLLNTGGCSSFVGLTPVPVGVQPLSIDAADLDNDADADLTVVAQSKVGPDRLVQVLENLFESVGDVDFDDIAEFGVDANANFVVAGELNNDAFFDLVTVNADDGPMMGSVTVLLGSPQESTPTCPWDCGDMDGIVGIVDFLQLLAEWTMVDTPCDFDGGGVGITDFLKLLANWGACPP